jgi:hypothetical protein
MARSCTANNLAAQERLTAKLQHVLTSTHSPSGIAIEFVESIIPSCRAMAGGPANRSAMNPAHHDTVIGIGDPDGRNTALDDSRYAAGSVKPIAVWRLL